MRWFGRVFAIFFTSLDKGLFQSLPRIQIVALFRRPCPELAEKGPRTEILFRLGVVQGDDLAGHDDLSLHGEPWEVHARPGGLAQLNGLSAVKVGVEDEATVLQALEQDRPGNRS